MKPLTIEELKALEVGDWVWIVDCNSHRGDYKQIHFSGKNTMQFYRCPNELLCLYSDYGTKWLAYKNKEQAEAKVALYKTAFELILQDVYETRLQADVLSCSSCPFMEKLFGECQNQGLYEDCKKRWKDYYLSQAKRRLGELKGEKR